MSVLVGRKAPDFTTPAVLSDGTLKDDFNFATATKGKYGLLFFYPLNFTFVCPSELVAVHNRIGVLQGLGVETVGISIDSHHSHAAFRNTSTDDGGIGNVVGCESRISAKAQPRAGVASARRDSLR